MSGHSQTMRSVIALIAAVVASTITVSAAVGPAQAVNPPVVSIYHA